MSLKLKKLNEQVVVITGASSGIGLATARMMAARGARVVLSSRNGEALQEAVKKIREDGGEAVHFEADVADAQAMLDLADFALRAYGGFDTWVNNAGVPIYGRLTEIPLEEKRRLFDVNFWGQVHGCRAALPHLQRRGGGAIINLGSVVSDRAIPLQGIYSASKHAVKAYTDALRMELEEQKIPVSVTLVKPSSIDTPWLEHARNHMSAQPTFPPPVYAPEVVASAICYCAENSRRDVIVGAGGKVFGLLETLAPRLTDLLMEKLLFKQQQSEEPAEVLNPGNLFEPPAEEGEAHGHYRGKVLHSSTYTNASLHPASTIVALGLAGFGAFALYAFLKSNQKEATKKRGARSQNIADALQHPFHTLRHTFGQA